MESICGDLMVIGLLMGMQAGFKKYFYFLDLGQSVQALQAEGLMSKSTFLPGEQCSRNSSVPHE